MTNAEVIDNIMRRLGGRTAPILRASVLLELNKKIEQLDQGPLIPWFLEERWEAVTVVNQDYLPLPADFSREVDEGRFKVRNSESKWSSLLKVEFEKLEDETENADPALPEGYSLFGERVYLGPAPDKAYSIKLPYYKKSGAVLDNSVEVSNKWLLNFYNLTTFETVDVIARLHIHSNEVLTRNDKQLREARDLFLRAVEGRIHANRDYQLED